MTMSATSPIDPSASSAPGTRVWRCISVRKKPSSNGQIWSRALHDINIALGRDTANIIILEAQFSFLPKTSFKKAAQRTVDAARALYDEPTAQTVIAQFQARGINGLA